MMVVYLHTEFLYVYHVYTINFCSVSTFLNTRHALRRLGGLCCLTAHLCAFAWGFAPFKEVSRNWGIWVNYGESMVNLW